MQPNPLNQIGTEWKSVHDFKSVSLAKDRVDPAAHASAMAAEAVVTVAASKPPSSRKPPPESKGDGSGEADDDEAPPKESAAQQRSRKKREAEQAAIIADFVEKERQKELERAGQVLEAEAEVAAEKEARQLKKLKKAIERKDKKDKKAIERAAESRRDGDDRARSVSESTAGSLYTDSARSSPLCAAPIEPMLYQEAVAAYAQPYTASEVNCSSSTAAVDPTRVSRAADPRFGAHVGAIGQRYLSSPASHVQCTGHSLPACCSCMTPDAHNVAHLTRTRILCGGATIVCDVGHDGGL
jgi:hypothetical protein